MPKGDFFVGALGLQGHVSVEVDRIVGMGGSAYPRLVIPMDVAMRPLGNQQQFRGFTLLALQTSLHHGDSEIGDSPWQPVAVEFTSIPLDPRSLQVEIPLDLYRLTVLEQRRQGGLTLRLFGSALFALHGPTTAVQATSMTVDQFTTGHFDVSFEVPQSHWVEKVLPGMGYGQVRLIELPVVAAPVDFREAYGELARAEEYFRQGDYDKVVAHCRSALEPLKAWLPSAKDKVSNSKHEWLGGIGEATVDWIDRVYKETRDLGSLAHHLPSVGHFSRFEAEAVLLVVVALLSTAGNLARATSDSAS